MINRRNLVLGAAALVAVPSVSVASEPRLTGFRTLSKTIALRLEQPDHSIVFQHGVAYFYPGDTDGLSMDYICNQIVQQYPQYATVWHEAAHVNTHDGGTAYIPRRIVLWEKVYV